MVMSVPTLSALEVRVIAVLFEKQHTTPDVYPLTLNALASGCNQKTSRSPVMEVSEADVQSALESLKGFALVIESYGASGRVLRYAHNLPKVLNIGQAASALLVTLMLRGAQTAAEIRANADRLYSFADPSSVEAYLEELANRKDGALVMRLPRQPGTREARWCHVWAGEPKLEPISSTAPQDPSDSNALTAEVAALREDVDALRKLIEHLYGELGLSKP
ncbi:MAG TPA: YceH family protein [Burkholderiales bacterium]|nr:YceH family protein [Burkholderiales bacterium]